MTETEFAQAMIDKYQALMLKAAGMQAINVDGQMTTFRDLEAQYEHWTKKLATLDGSRPRVAQISLGNQ